MPRSRHYQWQKAWDINTETGVATHKDGFRLLFIINPDKMWWLNPKFDQDDERTMNWVSEHRQKLSMIDYDARVIRLKREASQLMFIEVERKTKKTCKD